MQVSLSTFKQEFFLPSFLPSFYSCFCRYIDLIAQILFTVFLQCSKTKEKKIDKENMSEICYCNAESGTLHWILSSCFGMLGGQIFLAISKVVTCCKIE